MRNDPTASRVPPAGAGRAQPSPTPEPAALNFRSGHTFWGGRWHSLSAALAGVRYVLRTQPNAWIELAALVVVIGTGIAFRIRPVEWALLGLTLAMVLALEALNTAVESVVDLVSPQIHPLAKIAKDTAAGALVFAVLGSIWVAAFIFGPRLWELLF